MHRQAGFPLSVFAFVIAVLIASPLAAHHGTPINYTNGDLTTVKATVTGFDFKNPHVALFFDTTDKGGKVTHWSGEMASPSVYLRDGWTKKRSEGALKPGTMITISYLQSKAQESLPPGIGAALVVRIRDEKNERVLLDRR